MRIVNPQELFGMARGKQTEISVTVVFEGRQDVTHVFTDLILQRYHNSVSVEDVSARKHNNNKVFSGVRVERREKAV